MPLNRFHAAQDRSVNGYDAALEELRRGRKHGHWIWYIFPQLAGLGTSAMSREYAIADAAEARAYLLDPVLGERLSDATAVVADHLGRGVPLDTLMGSDIDATKLVSSLTLFRHAARHLADTEARGFARFLRDADAVLAAAAAQGYPACRHTLARLEG